MGVFDWHGKPHLQLTHFFQNRTVSHEKGSHGLPGIYFKYDLSPIRVKVPWSVSETVVVCGEGSGFRLSGKRR